MRRKITIFTSALLFLGIISTVVSAGTWGIGLGNPYVSLKYRTSGTVAYEVRAAFGSGLNVYSARIYRNFGSKGTAVPFVGVEGGTINFEGEDATGNGSFGMLFVGFEKLFTKKFSFTSDIGLAYISLSSEEASTVGLEWVVNLGIYYYS